MLIHLRPAIAMIELIFALVIMGITLLSAPLLLSTTIQSSNTASQQEAIAATSSQISLILTYPWDNNNIPLNSWGILTTTAGNPLLSNANRWLFPNTNRQFSAAGINNASIDFNLNPNMGDDIDNFNGDVRNVVLYTNENLDIVAGQGEYLRNNQFTLTTGVAYANDATNYTTANVTHPNPFLPLGVGSSDIKLITVTFADATGTTELNSTVSLSAFSCNIGASTNAAVAIN